MKTKSNSPNWRSPEAEKKFRVADAARWKRLATTLPDAVDVPTSFGSTRAHHWPGPGADVVLLHGLGDTSIRWIQFAEALAEHNVYAIDVMGEPGESVPEVPFESGDDYGAWLDETLRGLNLTEPHVVGHSLGGYIALSHATRDAALECTAGSYVLFDPVGVVKLRLARFLGWNAMVLLGAFSPGPVRRWAARRLRHPVMNDKADTRLLIQAQRDHPAKPMKLPLFTDDELVAIARPVRLVAGAKSSAFNITKMVRRIGTLVRNSHARPLANAGHALVMSHPDECIAEVQEALAGKA